MGSFNGTQIQTELLLCDLLSNLIGGVLFLFSSVMYLLVFQV